MSRGWASAGSHDIATVDRPYGTEVYRRGKDAPLAFDPDDEIEFIMVATRGRVCVKCVNGWICYLSQSVPQHEYLR